MNKQHLDLLIEQKKWAAEILDAALNRGWDALGMLGTVNFAAIRNNPTPYGGHFRTWLESMAKEARKW